MLDQGSVPLRRDGTTIDKGEVRSGGSWSGSRWRAPQRVNRRIITAVALPSPAISGDGCG